MPQVRVLPSRNSSLLEGVEASTEKFFMSARYVYIYHASKTAMQSGRALSQLWHAEFPSPDKQRDSVAASAWRMLPDAVMNWHGGGNTSSQVRLSFADLEEALNWAKAQGLTPIVRPQQVRKSERQQESGSNKNSTKPYGKSYAANFAHDRKVPWTH